MNRGNIARGRARRRRAAVWHAAITATTTYRDSPEGHRDQRRRPNDLKQREVWPVPGRYGAPLGVPALCWLAERASESWIDARSGRAGAQRAPTRDTFALRRVSRRLPTLSRRTRSSSSSGVWEFVIDALAHGRKQHGRRRSAPSHGRCSQPARSRRSAAGRAILQRRCAETKWTLPSEWLMPTTAVTSMACSPSSRPPTSSTTRASSGPSMGAATADARASNGSPSTPARTGRTNHR